MSAWSKIVRDDPAPAPVDAAEASAAAAAEATLESKLRDAATLKAGVDANAVFKGYALTDPNVLCVTIAEVLDEIRDAKGRDAVAASAGALEVAEPSEEAIEAVKRFANKTGDVHALSRVDMKLIALAYDLEGRCHGVEHLRTEPAPPRTHAKKTNRFEKQPGWDYVPNADDWAELDDMNKLQEEAEREMREKMAKVSIEQAAEEELRKEREAETAVARERRAAEEERVRALKEKAAEALVAQEHIVKDVEGDTDEWAPVICRTTRVRRQKREERARLAAEEAERRATANAEVEGPTPEELEEQSKRATDFFTSRGEIEANVEEEEDDDASTRSDDDEEVELESCVSSVTADYAMQNVILQMGLKLVAPDGMRIEHLRRWVLRCHACNEITRNLTRMFCPKCGNQTLQKVEHTVTRDGVEQFGVRKKFVLRGSKYTLPAPKGGRNAKKIILREDQLMSVRLTKKQVGEDVFAAEYTEESYADAKHFASQKTAYEIGGGDVRRNPNERRHVATNRRRK
jgi:RNA-binding protein NOB1